MGECINGCFGNQTWILMGNGSKKLVSEICEGDLVMLSTGKPATINDIYRGREESLYRITTGCGELNVTGSHPILTGGKWIRAFCIKNGDTVCTLEGDAKVTSVEIWPYGDTVYSLIVEDMEKGGIIANGFVVGDFNKQNTLK